MTEEVCVGVDIARDILNVAVSDRNETRQFNNNHKGITSTVRFAAEIILEEESRS